MELYILSKQDLSIQSICKPSDYEINLDEETNAKSIFTLIKCEGLKKENFIVANGLYKQFLFVIDDVQSEKSSNIATVTALDISNIFDRKIIEKDTDLMTTNSIEEFLANMINENFVNSDDSYINIDYIDIYWYTNTQGVVSTNAENGLYNFHTFLINCRQSKNIYTDFKFENGRLRIDIQCKEEEIKLIDTTVAEVTDYNKVYETDVTAKVQVLIREDNSVYNLYLKTDRTTTENKNDSNRAVGRVETISVDTADKAREEALNVMKGNSYNHLVEFKIAKTSKLMDITQLYIGRNVRIKTEDDIYDSYISAIILKDENFVYFKSGNLRTDLLDKLKKKDAGNGNKIDKAGGKITGKLDVKELSVYGKKVIPGTIIVTEAGTDLDNYTEDGTYFFSENYTPLNIPTGVNGWLDVKKGASDRIKQIWYRFGTKNTNDFNTFVRTLNAGNGWSNWIRLATENDIFYKPGDIYTSGNTYCGASGASISSSATSLDFTITLPKILDASISTITVEGLRIRGRVPTGGYLITSTSNYVDLITKKDSAGNSLSINPTSINAYGIDNKVLIRVIFDGKLSTTNNIPVSVETRNITLTFS